MIRKRIRFIKYSAIGLITVPIGLGALWLLTDCGHMHYLISNTIAFVLSTLCWWIMQSKWTFQDCNTNLASIPKSFVVKLIVLGVNEGVLALLVDVAHMWYVLAAIVALGVGFPIGYKISTLWIWKTNTKEVSCTTYQ